MRSLLAALALTTALVPAAQATTIYPLDRATILAGSPFDLKVEFDTVIAEGDVVVTVNGAPVAEVLGQSVAFVETEEGVEASAILLRAGAIAVPGTYEVVATAGDETKTVTWEVYATPDLAQARNVIFLIADGFSVAHRTGARLMSQGMTEGKADGRLNMDDVPPVAFIGTSATDSIATDSANTMSAYMSGHKTAVNALGVYADRTPDTLDDPRVETLAEAVKRLSEKSVGIVSNAEIEDATPAALVAHTRKRADKAEIVGMFLDTEPEVILGGGSAYFLPQSTPGSKRADDIDYIAQFRDAGYALATSREELAAVAGTNTGKILGLFHTGNLDSALDRDLLKEGTVKQFPNQPGLVEMTEVALGELSKNPEGFVLMVEAATVDKMSHPMDWDRAIYDTIEFDKVIGLAQAFQAEHPDTLIVVTGDHTHGLSIVGTIDDDKPGPDMRDKVGVYADAGFLNYTDENGDGYPDRVDVSKRLAVFSSNFPDYYETWAPKMDGPFVPTIMNDDKQAVANEAYKDLPGAVLRIGNLPRTSDTAVHVVDDVVLQASGPGTEGFSGYMEQSDVYRVLVDALALSPASN